jgi:zinc D-Ala-D-Ala dipeptidase
MRPWLAVPIIDCGEPLVVIPPEVFTFTAPHPYVAVGAPYGGASPWMLRQGVLAALHEVQAALSTRRPGWKLKLFDAYRPIPVQSFMVWQEFLNQARLAGISLDGYANQQALQARQPDLHDRLAATVYEFWALPSDDPATPPSHSTGAAIDLTLQDEAGREIDMGCPIDETTPRAYPDHYVGSAHPFHTHRLLLNEVMTAAGFYRHSNEWWHFSLGDQMWAWARGAMAARYGRFPPVSTSSR